VTSLREPTLGLVLTALAFLGGAVAASVLAAPPSVFAAPPAHAQAPPAAAPRRDAPPFRNR
jgi:hypothetical protein